jgi:hypothetical protein
MKESLKNTVVIAHTAVEGKSLTRRLQKGHDSTWADAQVHRGFTATLFRGFGKPHKLSRP